MVRTLQDMRDLARLGRSLVVKCRRCGHRAEFDPSRMVAFMLARRWSTSMFDGSRFRCNEPGCGARGAQLMVGEPMHPPPPKPPAPLPAPDKLLD
jgi:hypothetical protein